jgi:pSer/pThr/pTyr-binding forkhead associated (FHA) protein
MGHAATRPGGTDAGPAPDAPRVLAGFLVSFDSDELGTFWPIHQGRTTIGRKDAAEGLDLEIDHPTTSSRHAVILATARPGRLEIEDLGSTNGTFLENEKITTGMRYELRDGASLRFGGYAVIAKVI